ncbi:Thioredoxin H-type isoform E [Glycine soja]|uniref:Thioredoxin H-type isoform E n=1 Tax=Glycine soja TaxID=3848 RepID=A0A445L5Q8_GLYSO|nr:Thioredoxin H-type isoform E [Glycine soja]
MVFCLQHLEPILLHLQFAFLDCIAQADDDSDHNVEFASGNVQVITTKESWDQKLEQARRDSKIVIANFSATWCGPCKMIAPYYCELSEKYPSIMFLLVDVDELAVSSKAITIIIYLKLSKNILISTALYVDVHWETEIFICKSIIK